MGPIVVPTETSAITQKRAVINFFSPSKFPFFRPFDSAAWSGLTIRLTLVTASFHSTQFNARDEIFLIRHHTPSCVTHVFLFLPTLYHVP